MTSHKKRQRRDPARRKRQERNTTYLVCTPSEGLSEAFDEGMLRLVTADSPEEAAEKYRVNVLLHEDTFLEYLYSTSINASFVARFYRDDDGPFYDDYKGEHRVGPEYAAQWFEKNVRQFFSDRLEFAERYLSFAHTDESATPEEAQQRWQFPDEMLMYFCNEDFYGELVVFALDDIEKLA